MRLNPRLLAIAALVIVACAAWGAAVPGALASRAPTAAEKAAIAKSFSTKPKCLSVRVSTVDTTYAWSQFKLRRPPQGCSPADGIAVLKRRGKKWKPVFEGSSFTCSEIPVPNAVKMDLKVRGC